MARLSFLVVLLLLSAAAMSEALRELRGMQGQDAMKKAQGCKLMHALPLVETSSA
jgi:hypothetical protein